MWFKEENRESKLVAHQQLIIEELCGRDNGKRTYTVTPSELSSPISLNGIAKNAELLGYQVKTRGNLGITAISNNAKQIVCEFLDKWCCNNSWCER